MFLLFKHLVIGEARQPGAVDLVIYVSGLNYWNAHPHLGVIRVIRIINYLINVVFYVY